MPYIFSPPTHEEPIRTTEKPLRFYRLTWANSIVRINGVLTSVRSPGQDQLTAAGTEGVDFFMGGRIYTLSDATAAELTAAGYPMGGPGGYGFGSYGAGNYGGTA